MNQPAWQAMGFSRLLFYNFDQITSAKCYVCFQKYIDLQKAAIWKNLKATGELNYECHIWKLIYSKQHFALKGKNELYNLCYVRPMSRCFDGPRISLHMF